MLGLLVVLAIAVLFAAVSGLLVWLAIADERQRKRDRQRWAAAAQALGLTLRPWTPAPRTGLFESNAPTIIHRMEGERGGIPVCVAIRMVVTGSGEDTRTDYYTYVDVALPRSLALGLNVSPSSWGLGVLTDLFGARDLQVGHPAIDASYRIHATIADQARALLLAPYVAEALTALSSSAFRPHLTDSLVRLETDRKCLEPGMLSLVVDQAVDIAHRVVSARGSLGPSFVERVMAEVWRPVAEVRGFVLDAASRAMAGRAEGVHVAVHATQQGDACTTSFIVRFDRPLGLGLSLERQKGFSTFAALFGQDIETGDAMFDARFIVKGNPPDAVRAALTPEVRARLAALQEQATHLVVRDDHLRADVAWLVTEPAWLHAGIQAIARAGAALSGTGEVGVGPYRR